jgi:tripartite-type tricarboxylate transporter receptor subunit TctC
MIAIKRIGLLLAAVFVCANGSLQAADYPVRPVRFVVPFPPGGNADILARAVAGVLVDSWKQQLIIDNRAGAGGGIGTEIVAKAPPDGYTILLGTIGSISINPSIYKNLPYDPMRDLAPISLISFNPLMVLTHPSVPARNIKDLVALSKKNTKALTYGSGGNGTSTNLAVELFKSMSGASITHIPYRGAPLAATALISGEIALMFDNLAPSLPHVRSGRVRPLAVTSSTRSPVLPELPTVQESGIAGYEVTGWYGILAPAGTPADIVSKINRDVVAALKTKSVTTRLQGDGAEGVGSTPDEFARHIKEETSKWSEVVRKIGVKID